MLKNKPALLKSILFFIGLIALLGFLQYQIRYFVHNEDQNQQHQKKFIGLSINPNVIRAFLGVRSLTADLLWIDTLIKADVRRFDEPYTPLFHVVENIIELDPDNVFIYYVGGVYLSIIKDDVLGAKKVLSQGVAYVENAFQQYSADVPKRISDIAITLFFAHGYNLIFELQEMQEGSKWVSRAADMPNAPKTMKLLAKRVQTRRGQLSVASKVLGELYERSDDPAQRQRIEEKMLKVAVEIELLDLNVQFEKFILETNAEDLPKNRVFDLFMRSIGHSRKDFLKRPLILNSTGQIVSKLSN